MLEEVLLFLVSFGIQIFWRVFDVLLGLVILMYFNAIFIGFLCDKELYLHFYLFIKVKNGGGGVLVHVYVWEHIVSLKYRITWWIFTKLGRGKELMTSVLLHWLLGQIFPGVDPRQGHYRSIRGPSSKDFLRDWRLQQQTECIAII